MDFTNFQTAGQERIDAQTWSYFQGVAEGDIDRDTRAWSEWDLIPRVMTGLTEIDMRVTLGGHEFSSPIVLAPSASQAAAHPDGEIATRRAAAKAGMLASYSFHASVEVERFASAADAPWWAQAYVLDDQELYRSYLERCAAAGATAVVLTMDAPGDLADAPFRSLSMSAPVAARGNYPKSDDGLAIPVKMESCLTPDEIRRASDISGLPVWVKGILRAEDANRAIDAGAAGVYVSNHARRQLAGVIPTADVLAEIVAGVDGRAPVVVDGGIRSGTDAARALALGASAVAIGRPVPWALAAGGQPVLETVLETLNLELRVAMAGLGAGSVADLDPSMVRRAR